MSSLRAAIGYTLSAVVGLFGAVACYMMAGHVTGGVIPLMIISGLSLAVAALMMQRGGR